MSFERNRPVPKLYSKTESVKLVVRSPAATRLATWATERISIGKSLQLNKKRSEFRKQRILLGRCIALSTTSRGSENR